MGRPPGIEDVPAWDLTEGAELPDWITVVALHRDVKARTARVVTSEPASAELPADAPVPVVRR